MTVINQNFSITTGDSKTVIFAITDENGSPLSLLGSTAKWKMISKPANVSKDSTSGIVLSGSDFKLSLTPADTQSLVEGVFKHEGEITDSSGNVSTVFSGFVTITEGIV
jgi:hypothetical protein